MSDDKTKLFAMRYGTSNVPLSETLPDLYELLHTKQYALMSIYLVWALRLIPEHSNAGSYEHAAKWLKDNRMIIHYDFDHTWWDLAANYAADLPMN